MNIVITGSNGGIGSAIKSELSSDHRLIEINSDVIDLSRLPLNIIINTAIDGFIHCAGVNVLKPYTGIDVEEFYKLLNVNTLSFVELCKHIKFNRGANIIALGSLYSIETKEHRIQYTMSKHALLGAVKTLALEMSNKDIRVNMVSPGFVDTKLTRKNNSKDRIDNLNKRIPLGLTQPEDIANFCTYLITKNKAITGQNILIDGGCSLISK